MAHSRWVGKRVFATILAFGGAILPLAAALAAGPPAPAAAGALPVIGGGLKEVVITARKRKESAQTVPVDVTTLSGAYVRKQDISSLDKLAEMTPGFTVGHASNGSAAQLTLRGIGSSSTSIGIKQSVAVVVDGVYYGSGRVVEDGFFDLKQIELLKGPQALFYGKNATAGVIKITTADPAPTNEFIARINYEFRSQQTQAELIDSHRITDTLGLRVALRGSVMNGGYYTNQAIGQNYTTFDVAGNLPLQSHYASPAAGKEPGTREFLARVTLQWKPTDDLTGTLKLYSDYNHVNNNSYNYINYQCQNGYSTLGPPHYPCRLAFVTHQNNIPSDIAANFPFAENNGALFNAYQSYATTIRLNYKKPDYTLTSISNWQTNTNNWACECDFQSSPTGTWATEHSVWTSLSEELRLFSTFHGPLNFMVGAYAQQTRLFFLQYIMFAGLANSAAPSPQDVYLATTKASATSGKTYALFGQAIWDIVPSVELTAGVRYNREFKNSFFDQPYNNPALTGIFRPATAPLGMVFAAQRFSNVSPQVTLSWKPVTGIMLYGAYKTGFKSGGFDNGGINSAFLAANPATYMTFKPEKSHGFSLGVKSTVLNDQLLADLTLFDYKYTNLQVDFFNSSVFAFQTVTPDARTRGVELQLELAPHAVRGLRLNADVNYDDATYQGNALLPCYAGETAAAGCNVPTATVTFQNLNGVTLGMAPKVTGMIGGRYDWLVSNAGSRMELSADLRYSEHYLASSFNNPFSYVPSYTDIDASLRWTSANDRYQLAVVGKNLTNKVWVGGVVDGPSTPPVGSPPGVHADQLGFGNIPRTIQLQAQVRFGG